MDCKEFDKNVFGYVEGQLDQQIQAEMECHRSECAACAELAGVHETLLAALDSAPALKAPAALSGRILAAVAREEARIAAEERAYRRTLSVIGTVVAVMTGGLVTAWHYIYGTTTLQQVQSTTNAAEHAYFSRWFEFVSATSQLMNDPVKLPGGTSTVPLMYLGVGLVLAGTLAWVAYSQRRPAMLTV